MRILRDPNRHPRCRRVQQSDEIGRAFIRQEYRDRTPQERRGVLDRVRRGGPAQPEEPRRIAVLVPRTIARRLERRGRLTLPESERVLRIARVLARASDVLEGEAQAKVWLEQPSPALAGRAPIELLRTDIGTELVLSELTRIDHGTWA